ncbi:hypothetical protein [Synechococcus sp. M16CYN]|uniref:hypothetical protein n=1 Tax=Synechococcus sp. M16CYN TaxID=3103139 RepID=UPI00333F400D
MLLRLRLLAISFGGSITLLLVLCLGAQNLQDRHQLQVGQMRSVPLPTGFIIGMSVILGFVSGGSTVAFLMPAGQDTNNKS